MHTPRGTVFLVPLRGEEGFEVFSERSAWVDRKRFDAVAWSLPTIGFGSLVFSSSQPREMYALSPQITVFPMLSFDVRSQHARYLRWSGPIVNSRSFIPIESMLSSHYAQVAVNKKARLFLPRTLCGLTQRASMGRESAFH